MSCWRLYRQHHRLAHPLEDFVDCVPLASLVELGKDGLEEWEVPPEDGFIELQSSFYLERSSSPLSSTSAWETVSDLDDPQVMTSEPQETLETVVPHMEWKLTPIDVPPTWPFHIAELDDAVYPRLNRHRSILLDN